MGMFVGLWTSMVIRSCWARQGSFARASDGRRAASMARLSAISRLVLRSIVRPGRGWSRAGSPLCRRARSLGTRWAARLLRPIGSARGRMCWLTQQRRQTTRPPRSHSARALRPQQGAMNKDHDPPFGNFCNVTGIAVSRSPSRITVEVVSEVIAPEARKREIRTHGSSSRKIRMRPILQASTQKSTDSVDTLICAAA
jgi:hypothetical protein